MPRARKPRSVSLGELFRKLLATLRGRTIEIPLGPVPAPLLWRATEVHE